MTFDGIIYLKGKLKKIGEITPVQDKYSVRDIVLEVNGYPRVCQVIGNVSKTDGFKVDDVVMATIMLKGKEKNGRIYNLDELISLDYAH